MYTILHNITSLLEWHATQNGGLSIAKYLVKFHSDIQRRYRGCRLITCRTHSLKVRIYIDVCGVIRDFVRHGSETATATTLANAS